MMKVIVDEIEAQSPKFAAAVKEIRVETEGNDLAFTIESLLSTIEAKRAVIGAGTLNGLDSIGFGDLANLVKTNVVTLVSVHDHLPTEERAKLAHAQLASWISKARRRFPSEIFTTNYDYLFELKRVSAVAIGGLREEAITADSPIPFSIHKLWFELDDYERMTFKADRTTPETLLAKGDPITLTSNHYPTAGLGSSAPFLNNKAKGMLGFLEGMRSRLLDQSYNFLFRPDGYSPSLNGSTPNDLPNLFSIWFGHDFPVSILDLSAIPSNIMQTISGCILKIIGDALYWGGQNTLVGGKKQPLLIVLDEAHAYLKAGEESISSRTVQAIAKEGRKYGVGLLLVTQRPSELDETVLSQCGTMIALRMTNTRDKGHVSSAMQDELREMTEVLLSLRTGEAIVSGEAVRIPSRIKFYQADNAVKSSDPIASKLWANASPNVAEYETSVRNWRNQSFTQGGNNANP